MIERYDLKSTAKYLTRFKSCTFVLTVVLVHNLVAKVKSFFPPAHSFSRVRAYNIHTAHVRQVRRSNTIEQVLRNERLDALSFAVAVRHAGQVGGVGDGQGARLLALVEVTATDSTSVHIRHTVCFTDVVFLVANAVDTVVEVVARLGRTVGSGLRWRGRRGSGGCCRCGCCSGSLNWAASTEYLNTEA